MKTPYGLIGEKLGHSYSVPIHNSFGNNEYTLREISRKELSNFMTRRNFKAINVTIPYKTDVIPFLDEISDEARRINSVNTIVNRDGSLYGYNTDYYGFSYMARRAGISFKEKKVLILGSGGTSLTARTVAGDEGAREIVIISRTGENNYDNIDKHLDADIIVNTTPVGMFPKVDATPVKLEIFKNLCGVIDVIYNPHRTRLLIDAKRLGIPHINGLTMLAAQAKQAHELFFDIKADDSLINSAVKKLEDEKLNIVLVGMPGCGKTTIGKYIASKLKMDFCDTDEMIIKAEGKDIPTIFKDHGEPYFRNAEARALARATSLTRTVIATGGGAPLRTENQNAIMATGKVIWLKRDISELETRGRPLSKDTTALKEMYGKRKSIYELVSDYALNVAEFDKTRHEIIKYLNG